MEQPRPVTLPDSYNAQYQAFYQAVSEVGNRADKYDIMKKVFPHIAGSRFCSSRNQYFLNLADLTDGNIVRARVEIYDGAEHNKLDREILTDLRSFIKPLPAKIIPVVPNFFGVFKGSASGAIVPEQVARYFGAIGARGVQKLRSFAMEDSETICLYYHSHLSCGQSYYICTSSHSAAGPWWLREIPDDPHQSDTHS